MDTSPPCDAAGGAAFLEVLRHVLAPRLHEEAFAEGARVPGSIKALRLVCREAADIIADHVTRLRAETSPDIGHALMVASERFPSLHCLCIESLGLKKHAWQQWSSHGNAAASGHPDAAASAQQGNSQQGNGQQASVAPFSFAAVAGLCQKLIAKLRPGSAEANGDSAAAGRSFPDAAAVWNKQRNADQAAAQPSAPDAPASAHPGRKPQPRQPDIPFVHPELSYFIQALGNPACTQALSKLQHLSIDASLYRLQRAPLAEVQLLTAALVGLPSLQQLRLLKADVSPEALAPLASHPRLRYLVLYNCCSSLGIGPLTNLTRLDVGMQPKQGPHPESIPRGPDLSPLTGLQDLRAIGWILDTAALEQLTHMPHLKYLEARCLSAELTEGQLPPPSGLPALLEIRFTETAIDGLPSGTVRVVSAWCGASLRRWRDLAINVHAVSAAEQLAMRSDLEQLATLLSTCKAPQLRLSCRPLPDAPCALYTEGEPRKGGYLSQLLQLCLPTASQQRQVSVMTLLGFDVSATDVSKLVDACGWCERVTLRSCALTDKAVVRLSDLRCPSLELWNCDEVDGKAMHALLAGVAASIEAQGVRPSPDQSGQRMVGSLRQISLRGPSPIRYPTPYPSQGEIFSETSAAHIPGFKLEICPR